jgi:diguanylate cyclase (GGDEF)-like protein
MRRVRWWHWFGLAGLAVTVIFLLLPEQGLGQGILSVAWQAGATVALVIGYRRLSPGRRHPWGVLLGAEAVYLVANFWWYLLPVGFGSSLSYPSVLDPLFWVAYAGWAVFLTLLIRRHGGADSAASLDAVIISGGLGVLGWDFLLEPALEAPGVTAAARLASIVYPVLLLVLAALAVRLVMVSGVRTPAHALILAWIVFELGTDVWYSIASAQGRFVYGSPWSAPWLLSFTAIGCLALHPGKGTLTSAGPPRRSSRPTRRLVSLWLAVVVPLGVVGQNVADGEAIGEVAVLIVVVALVMGLVFVRLGGLLVDLDEEQRTRALLADQAEALQRMAFHDPLTGLANRALFNDRLAHALASRGQGDGRPAVLLLDLDRFKAVNDTRGHDAGDIVLLEVAHRLRRAVRPHDTVGRLGGDEFVVLLESVTREEAALIGERIRQALRAPVRIGDHEVLPSASIGLVLADPGDDPVETLQRADLAMYAAKGSHPGQVEIFVSELHQQVVDRYELENDLRTAIRRSELILHFQPIVELRTGAMVGVEALVRWQHPLKGLLGPDQFIPIAEESGTVGELGLWVLEEACSQILRWDSCEGGRGLDVAVNLSPRQLLDPALVNDVDSCLRRVGIDPARVTLEVTEGALLEDAEERIQQLHSLTKLGVTLAIDDFGTGYSSLSYLRRLPADILKIDRSFVAGIANEPQEWALASAIVRLAASVGKQTLAEGIERPEQLAHLLALGCRLGQGYLFSRPLPAQEIVALFGRPRLPVPSST